MPFGDGTGPRGIGPMSGRGAGYCAGYGRPGFANPILGRGSFGSGGGMGFGFRGASLPWPYVGRGRGGLPRCWYPGVASVPRYVPVSPYATEMTREQELDFLKGEAEAIKRELDRVEARIRDFEAGKAAGK